MFICTSFVYLLAALPMYLAQGQDRNRLCDFSPCLRGGTCRTIGKEDFECVCPPGISGVSCGQDDRNQPVNSPTDPPKRQEDDPCTPNPCRNNGECSPLPGGDFNCNCDDGFTGDTCQRRVPSPTNPPQNPCASTPCKNNGKCFKTGHTFRCQCAPGFIGTTCVNRVVVKDPCASYPCKNKGKCIKTGHTFRCQCAHGFTGTTCLNRVTNPCASYPCKNNGKCIKTGLHTFRCQCAHGFTGRTCLTKVPVKNPCASYPCKNKGTCIKTGLHTFRCECVHGFVGKTCEVAKCHPFGVNLNCKCLDCAHCKQKSYLRLCGSGNNMCSQPGTCCCCYAPVWRSSCNKAPFFSVPDFPDFPDFPLKHIKNHDNKEIKVGDHKGRK